MLRRKILLGALALAAPLPALAGPSQQNACSLRVSKSQNRTWMADLFPGGVLYGTTSAIEAGFQYAGRSSVAADTNPFVERFRAVLEVNGEYDLQSRRFSSNQDIQISFQGLRYSSVDLVVPIDGGDYGSRHIDGFSSRDDGSRVLRLSTIENGYSGAAARQASDRLLTNYDVYLAVAIGGRRHTAMLSFSGIVPLLREAREGVLGLADRVQRGQCRA